MKQFFLSDDLEVPALVQEKKKYAHFTVTPIGGPVELAAWRQEQFKKQNESDAKREALKEHQKLLVAGGLDAPEGDAVTWKGSASVVDGKGSGSTAMSWQDKLNHAFSERKRLSEPEIVTDQKAWVYEPVPVQKKTFKTRLKGALKRLWESATTSV